MELERIPGFFYNCIEILKNKKNRQDEKDGIDIQVYLYSMKQQQRWSIGRANWIQIWKELNNNKSTEPKHN